MQGSQQVLSQEEYGFLRQYDYETRNTPLNSNHSYSLWGVGTAVQRNGWATGKIYKIDLDIDALQEKVLDLGRINPPLTLEIEFDNIEKFIESDQAVSAIDWSISTIEFAIEHFVMAPDALMARDTAKLGSDGSLFYTVEHTAVVDQTVTTANIAYTVPHVGVAIDGIETIMRTAADITDMTINNRIAIFNKNGALDYRIKHGQRFYPERPIDCTGEASEAYVELLKILNLWEPKIYYRLPAPFDIDTFNADKFIETFDLRDHPHSTRDMKHLNSFVIQPYVPLVFYSNLSAPPANPQQLRVLIRSKHLFTINTTGKVSLVPNH